MERSRALVLTVAASALTGVACTSGMDVPEASPSEPTIEIFDSRALALLNAATPVRILARGHLWTEGPLWVDAGGFLLYSDIPNDVIMQVTPGEAAKPYLSEAGSTALESGDYKAGPNGLLLDADGRLVIFQQGDRRIARMDAPLAAPDHVFTSLVSRDQGKRLNSPNDGVFHSDGSLFFTDPPYGLNEQLEDPRKELAYQGVYRLRPDGDLVLLDRTVTKPNGIALSPDERRLYVAVSDERNAVWFAYDFVPDGSVTNRRVFYDATHLVGLPEEHGLPDGMAVHSSGALFATGPGGVWLFSVKGEVLAKVRTRQPTSNCTLSSDESVLYITANDTVMSIALKH